MEGQARSKEQRARYVELAVCVMFLVLLDIRSWATIREAKYWTRDVNTVQSQPCRYCDDHVNRVETRTGVVLRPSLAHHKSIFTVCKWSSAFSPRVDSSLAIRQYCERASADTFSCTAASILSFSVLDRCVAKTNRSG